ncbi:MAG TPA: ferritin-like domain-containing protein [Pseudomonadota bacterium]|nr:ferritin-like domain-containing protein [Pseudomonadota bacterium]
MRPGPASSSSLPDPAGPPELRAAALVALLDAEPARKQAAVQGLFAAWGRGELAIDPSHDPAATDAARVLAIPGRPSRPPLVVPNALLRRAMNSAEGRAIGLHALAHIEFNAINLALDAIWRFPGLPPDYYTDWLRVAAEEALHFDLLSRHLQRQGYAYGDFPAHNGLWEMAERTACDVLPRMALVPRTLEARGLDASPQVRAKLWQAGDRAAAEILDIILRDEIGHVAIGNRWFAHLCRERGLEPVTTYAELAERYRAPRLHGPFNLDARRAAGFTEPELDALQAAALSYNHKPELIAK